MVDVGLEPTTITTHSLSTTPFVEVLDRVDIHTHPYTTIACAAGVVTRTAELIGAAHAIPTVGSEGCAS